MPRENTRDNKRGVAVCYNKKYMCGQFLSPIELCKDCEFEVQDLFHGTNGLSMWCWYCSMEKVVSPEPTLQYNMNKMER
jgi:hypothetical protein